MTAAPATSQRRVGPAPWLLLLAALAAATAGQGGYYRNAAVVVALLVAAAAVAALAQGGNHSWGRPSAISAALGVLALWAAAAGVWAGHPAGAVATIALLAAVAAVVGVVRRASAEPRDQLVTGILALAAAAAATGWLGVVLRASPWAHPDGGLWRAATTITYANASAAVFTMAALLALARMVTRSSAATRLGVFAVLVGLGATLSRAGIATAALGYVCLALLLGPRRVVTATGRTVAGAAIAVIGLLPSMPVASTPRPGWAVVALLLGAAVAGGPRLERRWIGAAVAALALGVVPVLAFAHLDVGSLRANRVSISSPDRGRETHAALAMIRHHPLAGVGPGQAVFIWTTPAHVLVVDRYAHDEYLQLAAEQGLIGVALLALFAAAVVDNARRGRRTSVLHGGAVAALVAFAVHSGFDFLWHVPAVALMAAVVIGLTSAVPTATPVPPVPTRTKETV